MVGKKSGKALLREEGLERTDNNMDLTTWPQVNPINQKNYYTDYLKRDDQILALRLQNEEARNRMTKHAKDRDRALAMAKPHELPLPDGDVEMGEDAALEEDGGALTGQDALGSKVIVMHIGSQNLRIGLASDALPKNVPMVIARKSKENESEQDGCEPRPKRLKLDDGTAMEPEKSFGEEFANQYTTMSAELKTHMRLNKRRVLPNSKEMVVNYNRRTPPEIISEHNDPLRIDWTEIPTNEKEAPEYVTGKAALRIPDDSNPRYKLRWPIQHGWCNEREHESKRLLYLDLGLIIEDAIKTQLGLTRRRDWAQYGCVFAIPDLYEKSYVTSILDMLLRDFGFGRVCFIQESLAASFGAGFTTTCIVDIGAQKTSICCVEEGMCIENSRVNLKYGGADVTEAFIKMMLFDHFPYADINLKRRYDFLLAEELKTKFCTMNEAEISVQLYDFHLRASGQDTRKYTLKTYDEVLLAPMGYFLPTIFENSSKLEGRRALIDRSYDLYDGLPNDPVSMAQSEILNAIAPPLVTNGHASNGDILQNLDTSFAPARLNPLSRFQDPDATPRSSVAGSPAPEANGTPQPGGTGTPAPGPNGTLNAQPPAPPLVEERDDVLPVFPLDGAILTSIKHAARTDERKLRDFLGGIMVVGGGSQVPGFLAYLEERMHALRPGYAKEIMIGAPPRELDPQVVVWKGCSVFGKLRATNDSWIGQMEYDMLGSRLLAYKSDGQRIKSESPSPAQSPPQIESDLARIESQLGESTMANPADRRPEGGFKQDYISSTRYRNDLPPPPMPPKLLDIPHGGLAQYLTPGYASNLARREEPNIEVDAEGGMPIDMVGVPGYMFGDETAIMAPENPPALDPADLALLATPEQLRNPGTRNTNVSFLRRTQYISSGSGPRVESSIRNPVPRAKPQQPKQPDKSAKAARDDPEYIKKYIQKGFDIAYPESKASAEIKGLPATQEDIDAWNNPVHPDDPNLKPVDFYPVLPDLGGFTDTGGYMTFKFDKPPVPAVGGKRDDRMDVGVLRPVAPVQRVCQEHEAKAALHRANPAVYPDPGPIPFDYDLYLPEKRETVKKVKAKLSTTNENNDDEKLYTHDNDKGKKFNRYDRVRTYETANTTYNLDQKYNEVALALHDPQPGDRLEQKGAYYYPLMGKMRLKPERSRMIAQAGMGMSRAEPEPRDDVVDQIHITVRDPNPEEAAKRAGHRAAVDSKFAREMEAAAAAAEKGGEDEDEDMDVAESIERQEGVAEAREGIKRASVEDADEGDRMDD